MRNDRGYSLMEIVIAMAVFGMFLVIIVALTANMRANEKRYPINYMAHPEVGSVMARLRKDIFDTTYYPATIQSYSQTQQTLILYTLQQTGFGETVVYDFRTPGEVHRLSFNATQQTSDWVAHGVPTFQIRSFSIGSGREAVRIQATDELNRLAIDEIFAPRPHE